MPTSQLGVTISFDGKAHKKKQRMYTIVSTRHSGGSYLNKVQLMNGSIAKAHNNLLIPSTLWELRKPR